MRMPSFTPRNVVLGAIGLLLVLAAFLHAHLVAFLVTALVVIVVVLGIVVWLIMRELEAAKAGRGIEKELDGQVEREIERSTFGQQVEVKNLKAEWDAAIAEFKKSAAGRRLGDKALATMPMYLVLGPSAAGKTTLIQESGLQSALADSGRKMRGVRGVGGARAFQWFFTEQAILLDMSGKALKMSEFDDNEDWVQFLGSLRKMRPERPISGVVVTVPVTALAGGADAADTLAQQLRERARDLGHHLGMEFPVYVVLTHCDAIAGFAETFAAFDADDATQTWGMTLSVAKTRESAPEAVFDAEWTVLVSALGDLRTQRVARLSDDVQRMRALAFPAQLERLRPELKRLVQVLFARGKSASNDGPMFRGLYLTSSRVGAPSIERVLGDAARAVQVSPRTDAPTPEMAQHAWFSQQLWKRIVFKDAALASASGFALANERRMRWVLFGGGVGMWLLMTAVFGIVAWQAARPVRAAADAAKALAVLDRETVPRTALDSLEPLRAALARLERNREKKSFGMRVGGYAGDRVIAPALALYVQKAQTFLLDPVVEDVPSQLRTLASSDTSPFADLFYEYQGYRLLFDEHYEVEPADSVVLSRLLIRLHQPEAQRVPVDELRDFSRLVRAQARMLADHQEPKHRFGQFDPALASQALASIQRRWPERMTLYDDMIADANSGLPDVTLESIAHDRGGKFKFVMLASTAKVPGAYSQAGWHSIVRSRLQVIAQMTRREKDPQFVAAMGDEARNLSKQLGTRYAGDYATAWAAFMNGIRATLTNPNGRRELAIESTPAGEIEAVLRRVDAEAQLEGAGTEMQAGLGRLQVVHDWLTYRPAGKSFVGDLKSKLPFAVDDAFLTPHERWQRALKVSAKDRLGLQNGELYDKSPQAFAYQVPDSRHEPDKDVHRAMSSVLTCMKPVKRTAFGATGGAGGGIGGAGGGGSAAPVDIPALISGWRDGLEAPFAEIGSRYPFDGGGDDVRLGEFAAFFGPGGALDKFYDAYLKGHMDRDGNMLDDALPLSGGHVAWLKKALAIQQAFYGSTSGPKVMFDVTTKPSRLAPAGRLHSVTWHVGDKDFSYEMGEERETLTWAEDNSGGGSWVSADLDGSPVAGPRSEGGDWGLFHVLDKAALSPSGDKVIATWKFGGVTMALEISPKQRVHPFASGFLRLGPPPAGDF
ncbi:MAG: type VI secretion protein IcmF/TssM N-terminal domain-containing protein [Candidatus Eisenbacteria bacterium]